VPARREAALLAGQRDHCPQLAATPLLDTVRLARAAAPGLTSYRLDTVIAYYGVPRPADRHRALPDTEVTAAIFALLLADGASVPGWAALTDLDAAAGRPAGRPAGPGNSVLSPKGVSGRIALIVTAA
jgi:DNA polymerase-3 subunit epsilon